MEAEITDMEFVAGICPQCGGEIQLDPSKDAGYCMHCGVKIYTKDALESGINIKRIRDNYITIAEEAIKSGNWQEALLYVNRSLEIDPSNSRAWYVKMQVSYEPREIKNCFQNVIENMKSIEDWTSFVSYIMGKVDDGIKLCGDESSFISDLKLVNETAETIFTTLRLYTELMKLNFSGHEGEKSDISGKLDLKLVELFAVTVKNPQIYTYNSLVAVLNYIVNHMSLSKSSEAVNRWEGIKQERNEFIKISRKQKEEEFKSKEGACFIATAVYGSYDAPNVITLRKYRDTVLGFSIFGRLFIKIYYKLSPPIAGRLKDHHKFNSIIRNILDRWVCRIKSRYNF